MHDLQGIESDYSYRADSVDSPDFASWVVQLLATRRVLGQGDRQLRKSVLKALVAASIDENPLVIDIFLRDLARQKVTAEVLADVYVPAAARELGVGWVDDIYTFIDVTLGSSRLQYILRCVGAAWSADCVAERSRGSVLLVTSGKEQHSLGALVLLGQLRRRGVSVCLALGATRSMLRDKMSNNTFDAIMVSTSASHDLQDVNLLLQDLRGLLHNHLPIVVGGRIALDRRDEILGFGADDVANDVDAAMDACGLVQGDVTARKSA